MGAVSHTSPLDLFRGDIAVQSPAALVYDQAYPMDEAEPKLKVTDRRHQQ
jgi:hypothetical protein